MSEVSQQVLQAIPQRAPFLFVDKIIERSNNVIHTQKLLTGQEDFFKGHFPGNPIMPGVLLCEACFQTGAILMSANDKDAKGTGVVTRIRDTKFKNFVKPGDLMDISVTLEDHLDNAFYMSGQIKVNGSLVLKVKFQGALVPHTN